MEIIGRKKEIALLKSQLKKDQSRIVVVSGRRRVGKTFLVDGVYETDMVFRHSATSPAELMKKGEDDLTILQAQINDFLRSLERKGYESKKEIANWHDAFFELEKYLELHKGEGRKVVFLDELPWMDTPRSFLLRAFNDFWSNYVLPRGDLVVVVAGSANSWILDNFVYASGSLYKRQNCWIELKPFTLAETREFLLSRSIRYSLYDITNLYMVFGGIPYYLDMVEKGLSVAENVYQIFFENGEEMKREFDNLFNSIFAKKDKAVALVRAIASKRSGLSREEIEEKTGMKGGGTLSKYLGTLQASSFILEYRPYGAPTAERKYRLIDPFCLFILRFVEVQEAKAGPLVRNGFRSPTFNAWKGYSFESVCFSHAEQIKNALRIGGVISTESTFIEKGNREKEGAQIDLLIIRDDNIINLCEAKFVSGEYVATKKDEESLGRKEGVIRAHILKKQAIHRTLITTFGLEENEYSGIYEKVITLDVLFKD